MELSRENQELLDISIAKGINWNGNPVYQSEPIKVKLLQDQQKIEELEKENARLNARLKGDFSSNSCNHKFRAHWAHSECEKCGAVHLGNSRQDREDYGVAANKTFRNMAEARFYQANGLLPEDNKQ